MTKKKIKVIFDTNIWISFLIGKRLSHIENYIFDTKIMIVSTEKLTSEILDVCSRERFKKYFDQKDVENLLKIQKDFVSENYTIIPKFKNCRDPKDNYLLDLIDVSKADFLITGDKDLLELNPFLTAKIISASDFENKLKALFED